MASTVAREQEARMLLEQQQQQQHHPSEIDSESSSGCEDRDARKRLREDVDNSSTGSSPKKRRKQTTPVRFPTTPTTTSSAPGGVGVERAESDDEGDENDLDDLDSGEPEMSTSLPLDDEDHQHHQQQQQQHHHLLLEGKPRTLSPQAFIRNILQTATATPMTTTTNDENLNCEFRCQLCGVSCDGRDVLERHLECEHGVTKSGAYPESPVAPQASSSPLAGQVRIKIEPPSAQSQQSLDEPESPVNLTGLGIKSFAATWLNSQQQQHHLLSQSQSQNPDDWSSSNPAASLPANHLQALSFPGALAQYLPLPGFSLGDAGQLPPRPPVGPAPVRIFNPDAYCDLCNKEFCNKYFLKTHKANKHGIYVDAPPGGQNPGGDSSAASSVGNNVFAGAFAAAGVKLEQQHSSSNQQRLEVPSPLVSMPLNNAVTCDVCQKRFKNDDSLRKHRQKVHNDPIDHQESHSLPATGSGSVDDERDAATGGQSPSAMEQLFRQEFGVEQEDARFMPTPRHLSPQSSQQARDSGFNADRLRRLGVINPEAFCEICCKEYCNKYFLRTHKMKRHGLCVQETSEKSPSNPGNAATWHQIQTSPLNLIVTDGGGSGNAGSSSESGDRPGEDFECRPCGLRFQTQGLQRAHRRKMHEAEGDKSPKAEPEADTSVAEQRTHSISEDLQKLQTMILQLNGLTAGKAATCGVCGKDCENVNALRTHVSLEHGVTSDELSSPTAQPNDASNVPANGTSTFCTLCDKELPSLDALRQHITEEHQQPASSNNSVSVAQQQQPQAAPVAAAVAIPAPATTAVTAATASTPTATAPPPAAAPQPERKVISMTPTSSYCEICNKELCNKYFMKTHMQRMHNIEIENGSQIGGVICNICNKELCSKYFLRVHKQNTHGIVDEGSTAAAANKQESYEPASNDDSALKPDQLGDLSHRYFTHFTEVCPICSRRFRSIKWLKAHLLGEHGRPGVEKWREMEHQYQSSPRGGARSAGASSRGGQQQQQQQQQQNHSLKIPNGLDAMQQIKGNDYAGLGNHVLSSLFGSAVDEQQAKNYRCSYCSFTTTVLPFLFLHERSHAAQDGNTGADGGASLQCPVCTQGFAQPELLHHHLLTHHQFAGLLSQFQAPIINNPRLEDVGNALGGYEKNEFDGKDERRQTSPQVSAESLKSHQRPADEQAIQVTPHGAFKCGQCGYATANVNRIRKHIKKDHKTLGDPTDSVIDELSKTLRDVANKNKVPASYAMPQDMNSNPDATVMQPFIIEEQRDVAPRMGDESANERRFAPALVYLPVRARVNSVLTASFTLSPA